MTFIDDLDPDLFLAAGDWHGSIHQARSVIGLAANVGEQCSVILQAGDTIGFGKGAQRFLNHVNATLEDVGKTLIFAEGNHEDFPYLNSVPLHEDGYRVLRKNIIHLPRGFRWEWGGMKFAALGGAASVDKQWREEGKDWFADEEVSWAELDHLVDGGPADVLLMHDSPFGAPNPITDNPSSQAEGMKSFGKEAIDRATEHRRRLAYGVNKVDPSLIIHGHYHRRFSDHYTRRNGRECRVICLDEGSRGVGQNAMLFDPIQMLPQYGRDYTETDTK